jgi:hypothetical protein
MIIKALIMQIYIILHNRGFIFIILALFTLNSPLPRKELNLLLEEVGLGLDMKKSPIEGREKFLILEEQIWSITKEESGG